MEAPRLTYRRKRWSTTARQRIFDTAGGRCHICSLPIDPGQAWELEHVIALGRGGEDVETNLRPAHANPCHSRKTREEDIPEAARVKRVRARHTGAFKAKRPFRGWRKMSGEIVWNKRGR